MNKPIDKIKEEIRQELFRDIEKYRKEQIDSTVLLIPSGSIMSNLSAIAMFKEQDRLEKLTPEELGLEVLRSAETKAKLWKLILNA